MPNCLALVSTTFRQRQCYTLHAPHISSLGRRCAAPKVDRRWFAATFCGIINDHGIANHVPTFASYSSSSFSASVDDGGVLDANSLLPDIVQQTIYQEILPAALLPQSEDGNENEVAITIVLGVSGGCDSVALLYAMHNLRQADVFSVRLQWDLVVVHFDHQQRGDDSAGDRLFVQQLCEKLRLPLHCYYWDQHRANDGGSNYGQPQSFSQDLARQWRRTTMRQLLQDKLKVENGYSDKIHRVGLLMTAHHKDDSDETMLLKLLRGVHITNVTGLQVVVSDNRNDANTIYWARPLLHVRKADIVRYLRNRQYIWREDASNQTNKYLRNRVRNELIPLLQDMVGVESLERRLQYLQEQSRELRCDLECRARVYFKENTENGIFLLPADPDQFDLAVREALHMWVVTQSHGHQFGYEHTQRVCKQIHASPGKRNWRLNIGNGWDIQRKGDALRLVCDEDTASKNDFRSADELAWCRVEDFAAADDDRTTAVVIKCPQNMASQSPRFLRSIVRDRHLFITPSWRKGRSPIRVGEFLRGQQVPLHMRQEAPIITLLRDEGRESLVAVYVITKNKWVVDAEFASDDYSDTLNRMHLTIKVDKQSLDEKNGEAL